MKKIDHETVEASKVHGKEYARKVGAILELARVMSCENYGYDWKDYRPGMVGTLYAREAK